MTVHEIDPMADARWRDLVARHPDSSIFHDPTWLQALRRTYRYEPVAFTDSPPRTALTNTVLFCRVRSHLTGNRLVSLPFSDHCDPLLSHPDALAPLLDGVRAHLRRDRCRYIELRPRRLLPVAQGFGTSAEFWHHTVDLRPDLATVHGRFHKSCVQRTIRRASRLGVTCDVGRSPALLDDFYRLQTVTRRRHRLPPQPREWFRHLVECPGSTARIHVARVEGRAIAAMLTARHRDTVTYKYGCSEARDHRYGGMPLLFWEVIRDAKQAGCATLDLGRSDLHQDGLVRFKDHLGAERTRLRYLRCPEQLAIRRPAKWARSLGHMTYPLVPTPVMNVMAKGAAMLYRHFG